MALMRHNEHSRDCGVGHRLGNHNGSSGQVGDDIRPQPVREEQELLNIAVRCQSCFRDEREV